MTPKESGPAAAAAANTPAKAPGKEAAAPARTVKKSDGAAAGFYCYIGPGLPGLLRHGAVFPGTRADALRAAAGAIEKQPLVKTLIVSGDDLPAARLEAKQPGSALYENCRRIAGKS